MGPNRPGRPSKGLTRGRWTFLCFVLLVVGVLFPPTRQHGEFAVDGRISEVNHEFWPSWIGNADGGADIGYSRNGQMQTVTWNITREINRPAWFIALGIVMGIWVLGMFRPGRKVQAAVSRYPQVIVPKTVAPPAAAPRAEDRDWQQPARLDDRERQQPARADDRDRLQPPRRQTPLFPGVSVPGDMGSVRRQPPPGGRYR